MHPTNILQLALLAASQVVAAPTEPASQPYAVKTLLGKRADPAPVTCGRKLRSYLVYVLNQILNL